MLQCNFEYLYCGGRDKSTYFEPHKHQAYELVYYLKGNGRTTINGVKYEYSPGTFTITEPGHTHDEFHTEDTYVIYIIFTYARDVVDLVDGIFCDTICYTIRNILEEMKKEFYAQAKYFKIKLGLLTEQLIIELSRIFEKQQSSDNISFAVNYMNENYRGKIYLKLLAEKSGYSYNHFRRLLTKRTGMSPINYIMLQRIENAKYLLRYTNLPIMHISQECGFATESQFCSIFKRKVLQTPMTYRKCN